MSSRDPEKRKEEYRRYREKYGDLIRARQLAHYHAHKNDPGEKEKVAERQKRWINENREDYLARRRRYTQERRADPERHAHELAYAVANKAKRRAVLTAIAEEAKGSGCRRCGERELICLDFHHRDPSKKAFPISARRADLPSVKRFLTEIAKCDVLCANCHWKSDGYLGTKRAAKDPNSHEVLRNARRRQQREERWGHTVLRAKRSGCSLCCEDDDHCLQFHHVDPKTKTFHVGSYRTMPLRTDLWLEIQKCMVLCVNCHRRVHAGIAALPDVSLESYWHDRIAA